MSSTKMKENLIEIIFSILLERHAEKKIETKLVIPSNDEFPEEAQMGVVLFLVCYSRLYYNTSTRLCCKRRSCLN